MKIKTTSNPVPLQLINQPLAIAPGYLDAYLSAFRPEALQAITEKAFLDGFGPAKGQIQKDGDIAIIPVCGPLQHRSDIWSYFFGTGTYEQIRADFRAALNDSSVRAILFDVESPGGEVAGIFDLAEEIYQARGQKPIFAFANEYAFSAAYAIVSAAEKIYLPKTGQIGSIGVIAVHVDQSGYDEKIGVKYTPIFAGDRKNDFSPHSALSEAAFETAKASVDRAYGFFTEAVATHRGMKKKAVIDTQAGIFDGAEAVSRGLADGVMSYEKVIQLINKQISTTGKGKKMEGQDLKTQLSALIESGGDQAKEALAALGYVPKSEAKPEDTAKIKADAEKVGISAELARTTEIFDLCELAGLADTAVIKGMISEGVTIKDARAKIIEAKAAQNDDTLIRSTHSGLKNGGVNPLIANARKRAGLEG